MLDLLIAKTWKGPRRKGLEKMIQEQNEQILLTYLLAGSINNNLSFAAKGQVLEALNGLKNHITTQQKTATDKSHKAHLALALERMKTPEQAKPTLHTAPPPGAPIGCDVE
jgi:transcriptional regulatory protein LevR